VGPRAGLDTEDKGIEPRSPGRPARSQSVLVSIIIHGPHRKSPGDEQEAHRGHSSEISVSPHHSQSTHLEALTSLQSRISP
jgi:hypothetical protein